MIEVLSVAKGKLKKGGIENIPKGCWIDCVDPSRKDLEEISKKTKIAMSELLMGLDDDERPKAVDFGNYALIVFKSPSSDNHEITASSFASILSKNRLITIRKKQINSIEDLKKLLYEKNTPILGNGPDSILHEILGRTLNEFFRVLEDIEDRIDYVEHALVKTISKSLMIKIFEIKKTLIYFHKALTANREVIMEIEKGYIKSIPKNKLGVYRKLYYDVTELIDLGSIHQDIVTGTLDVYLSSVSNNLNAVMKKLTAYGALILVPTLISGVYGMNFRVMPELYWHYGYAFALGLMVVSVLALYIYFKKEDWL